MSREVVVVGGGAAGMMAAITAAEQGGQRNAAGAKRAPWEKAEYYRKGPLQRHERRRLEHASGQHAEKWKIPVQRFLTV